MGEVIAPSGHVILVDDDDLARLNGRSLSIGSHGYAQMWDDGDPTLSNLNRSVKGRGVYQVPSGRFQAKFSHRGRCHYLGTFDSQEAAELAVLAERDLLGIRHDRFEP